MAKKKKKNYNTQLKDLIEVKTSKLKGAGFGAFARVDLPKGKRLGEYTGKLLSQLEYDKLTDTAYVFEVTKRFRGKYYLFYIDAKRGDDLRFVNGAHSKKQKKRINIESYQYGERIFYRTTKAIKAGEELLIDYGDNYWLDES